MVRFVGIKWVHSGRSIYRNCGTKISKEEMRSVLSYSIKKLTALINFQCAVKSDAAMTPSLVTLMHIFLLIFWQTYDQKRQLQDARCELNI